MEWVVKDERRGVAESVGAGEVDIAAVRVRGKVECERLEARVRALGREVDELGDGIRLGGVWYCGARLFILESILSCCVARRIMRTGRRGLIFLATCGV